MERITRGYKGREESLAALGGQVAAPPRKHPPGELVDVLVATGLQESYGGNAAMGTETDGDHGTLGVEIEPCQSTFQLGDGHIDRALDAATRPLHMGAYIQDLGRFVSKSFE